MSTRYNGAYIIDLPDAAEDPSPAIEKDCHGSCLALHAKYEACAERIEGKPDAHCTGQYMDYLACIDKCSAGVSLARGSGDARAEPAPQSRRSPRQRNTPSDSRTPRSQKVCAHPGLERASARCVVAAKSSATRADAGLHAFINQCACDAVRIARACAERAEPALAISSEGSIASRHRRRWKKSALASAVT
jgi:ubiquinol-cytochrome c reductase subunit 6